MPTPFTIALRSSAATRIARFLDCSRAVAAVEFAMVLPFMLLMYLGATELTFGVNTDRKLTFLSRTLADLTSRSPTALTSDAMTAIFNASLAVMAPYKTDTLKMVVSSIAVLDTGQKASDGSPILQGKVCWSQARGTGATALATGTQVPVPAGFGKGGTSFIEADVQLPYKAMFGAAVFKTIMNADAITLSEKTPWPVRNATEVAFTGQMTFKDSQMGRPASGKCLT